MIAKEERVIQIVTTPKELRELADKMEKFWASAKWGQELTVCTIGTMGVPFRVEICINQEEMPSNGNGIGRKDLVGK